MKTNLVILVLLSCFSLGGCKRSGDIKGFIADLDAVTAEITKKIAANDVAGAKSALDAKKPTLKAQIEAIKQIPDDKIPQDHKESFIAAFDKDLKAIDKEISIQSLRNSEASDPAEKLKALADNEMMSKIQKDFMDIVN